MMGERPMSNWLSVPRPVPFWASLFAKTVPGVTHVGWLAITTAQSCVRLQLRKELQCPLRLTTHSYLLPDAAPLGSEGSPVFSPLLGTLRQSVGFPFPRGRCISLVAAGVGTGCECTFTPHRTASYLAGQCPASSPSSRGSALLCCTWFRGNVSHPWFCRSPVRPRWPLDLLRR